MRFTTETGAALALTIALSGCSPNSIPEEPIGLVACSQEVAAGSLMPEENPDYFIEELRGATQEDLAYVLQDSFGILATVSVQAEALNPSGNIEVPNLQQPTQSFEHTVDLDAGTLTMVDTVLEDPMCQISAIQTEVTTPHEQSKISVELSDQSYAFVYNPTTMTATMHDNSQLTPEAVGTISMLATRYARIVIDAANEFAPIEA